MRGDIFHYEDRAYVPVKHEMKKGFFVALREGRQVLMRVMQTELPLSDRGAVQEEAGGAE